MSDSECEGFYLSRQPILAGERRLVGWALHFGSPAGLDFTLAADDGEAHLAAIRGFSRAANWDALLCGGRALLAADRRLIFSDVFEHVPRDRILLGLAPTDEVDASLSNRLHELYRHRGIRLLFRGYRRRDAREDLLDLADAVEVDAFGLDAEARAVLVRRAHRRKLQVMATSVECDADFRRIRDDGFELFVGRSYAEHSADAATQATPDGRVLLQLLVEARGDLEIDRVTAQIESNPALAEGLLRLVNSLELARAQKIENVGQALIMVGSKGLSRWLSLLLFQSGSRHGAAGPLFKVAASRARLMELLAGGGAEGASPESKSRGELAFLVGIMSLVHVLLGLDRARAIGGLSMPHELSRALTAYEGPLGRLLRLAECLDRGEFLEASEVAAELGLTPEDVWGHQRAAFDWVMKTL